MLEMEQGGGSGASGAAKPPGDDSLDGDKPGTQAEAQDQQPPSAPISPVQSHMALPCTWLLGGKRLPGMLGHLGRAQMEQVSEGLAEEMLTQILHAYVHSNVTFSKCFGAAFLKNGPDSAFISTLKEMYFTSLQVIFLNAKNCSHTPDTQRNLYFALLVPPHPVSQSTLPCVSIYSLPTPYRSPP